jgi:hypothetical protein
MKGMRIANSRAKLHISPWPSSVQCRHGIRCQKTRQVAFHTPPGGPACPNPRSYIIPLNRYDRLGSQPLRCGHLSTLRGCESKHELVSHLSRMVLGIEHACGEELLLLLLLLLPRLEHRNARWSLRTSRISRDCPCSALPAVTVRLAVAMRLAAVAHRAAASLAADWAMPRGARRR